MELEVFTKDKKIRAIFSPDDSSEHHAEVEGDDYVSLSCNSYECITLEIGDYVMFQNEKFILSEEYTPKMESTGHFKYSVKFYGSQSNIKSALMLNTEKSPLFVLTGPARQHLDLVVSNLNRWQNTEDWKAGTCASTENIVIDYSSGVYCNEALKKIADAAETEWWIEGMTVNIGKCELGDPITLSYGNGLINIERQNADNVKFFTRLFPIGSSKNIDPEKYGYSTLQLPSRESYVEKNIQWGIIEHFEKDAFNDIFPKRTGVVSSVRSEVQTGDEGEFNVYYFADSSLNFDPNEYEIAGLVKYVIFQSGELAGRDFEVNFDSQTQEFEIITTWPYGDDMQIPGGLLIPKENDKYVIYNISMPIEYYTIAEKEYAIAVDEFLNRHSIDRCVYKSPTDYTYIDKKKIELKIGQRIRLESDRFFRAGYRNSRITVITQSLNYPGKADIDISDVLSKTSQSKLTDDIENVRNEIKTSDASLPDIIRSNDATPPTDNNLFSARRTKKEFISKKYDDTAAGHIVFEGGITAWATTPITDNNNAVEEIEAYSVEEIGETENAITELNNPNSITLGGLDNVEDNADNLTEAGYTLVSNAKGKFVPTKMDEVTGITQVKSDIQQIQTKFEADVVMFATFEVVNGDLIAMLPVENKIDYSIDSNGYLNVTI